MKRFVIAVSVMAAVILGYFAFTSYQASQPIQNQVQGCFKRFTVGESYSRYAVEVAQVQGSTRREAITDEQIDCVAKRLGFASNQIDKVKVGTSGRIDLDDYAIIWGTEKWPVCDGLRKWGCTAPGKPTQSTLRITFKDYR
jgi:hypothetical protein